MGTRAPRKAKVITGKAAVQVRVAGLVDGFLEVMPEDEKRPVREKVVRKLRQLHPMD
ncbi:MAG TPA: hypothetical protein VFB81_14855 [Myxococcales bacterium]|nr:hypothetical protein [Myxococcales bacterium]